MGRKGITVTRDDVAKLAGVAPSTVSNVINNKGNVSDKLKKRIQVAIKELNYKPNLVARSLMTRSSKHIGLIIDEITNPHFAQLAKGAHYEAERNGYILSISLGTGDVNNIIEDFLTRHIDGIIYNTYMGQLSPRMKDMIKQSGISYVDCNGQSDHANAVLEIDYYQGMKDAYYYLRELGHEKIAYISGLGPSNPEAEKERPERLEAFYRCCSHLGGSNPDDYVVLGEAPYYTNFERGYQYGCQLLDRNLGMTAVIVANDYMAIGVLRAFKERGIEIPEDISIISFDNTVYAESSNPALTSLNSSVFDMGRKAVEYIIQQQEIPLGDRTKFITRFPMKLIARESTAPPK